MKFKLSSIIYLTLVFVLLGQMVKSACYADTVSKNSVETPLEESGDEDADNENEDDKAVCSLPEDIENTGSFLTHQTYYQFRVSSQIREVSSPPPQV